MRLTRRALLVAAPALALGATVRAAARDARPMRIVSLNPCLDAILLRLAEPARVAALSHYARDSRTSAVAAEASSFPFTYETAEEIVALRPDLVLASRHTAIATRNALERLGIPFALFGVPDTVEDSLAQIAEIARLTGAEAQGAMLEREIRAAIAAAAPPPGLRPIAALILQGRGLAAGPGTLLDEMLARTGFVNAAARYGVVYWGEVPLELLIADPPQLLLSEADGAGFSQASRMLGHPALAAVSGRMARAAFPETLFYCGGPVLLKTAAALVAARDAYWAAHA